MCFYICIINLLLQSILLLFKNNLQVFFILYACSPSSFWLQIFLLYTNRIFKYTIKYVHVHIDFRYIILLTCIKPTQDEWTTMSSKKKSKKSTETESTEPKGRKGFPDPKTGGKSLLVLQSNRGMFTCIIVIVYMHRY